VKIEKKHAKNSKKFLNIPKG